MWLSGKACFTSMPNPQQFQVTSGNCHHDHTGPVTPSHETPDSQSWSILTGKLYKDLVIKYGARAGQCKDKGRAIQRQCNARARAGHIKQAI